MNRTSILGFMAMVLSVSVPTITTMACDQKKPVCVDKSYRGMECSEDQRIEVHGDVAVCRCVRPEPAVSR